MAFINDSLNELKPSAKNISSLDFLSKYKSDLDILQNGKYSIERKMAEKGIKDAEADKQLEKLTKSIEKLKQMIADFEKEYIDE